MVRKQFSRRRCSLSIYMPWLSDSGLSMTANETDLVDQGIVHPDLSSVPIHPVSSSSSTPGLVLPHRDPTQTHPDPFRLPFASFLSEAATRLADARRIRMAGACTCGVALDSNGVRGLASCMRYDMYDALASYALHPHEVVWREQWDLLRQILLIRISAASVFSHQITDFRAALVFHSR